MTDTMPEEPVMDKTASASRQVKLPDQGFGPGKWANPEQIVEALKDAVDPELGVNIVDLGLIYGVDIDDQGHATIDMTLTAPTCPLTDQLEMDVRYLLATMTKDVVINWVWLPPWTLDMISEDGREQLRALGFNL